MRAPPAAGGHSRRGGTPPRLYQITITLSGARPPVWRRVLVPASATLGLLHRIIRVVMDWHDDHLHLFAAGARRYADPFHGLEECGDEDAVRLLTVLPKPRATIAYVYDLGDCWRHEIKLEKILEPGEDTGDARDPICVAGHGDAPVEDWDPEFDDQPTTPYGSDQINRRLATLTAHR